MPVNAALAHRLAHPTPQDKLDLPDEPRSSLIRLHLSHHFEEDGTPALHPALVSRLSRMHRRSAEIAAGIPYTEGRAREILAETDWPLSLVLEACHYRGEPIRAVAARLRVGKSTVQRRLAAARERIEAWTGKPPAHAATIGGARDYPDKPADRGAA